MTHHDKRDKRKYGFLVGLLFVGLIVVASAYFTSDDMDEICSTDGSVMARNSSEWYCRTGTYAELWGDHIGEVSMASVDTWYNITNLTYGKFLGITNSNGELTISKGGLYQLNSQISFSGTPNNEYHGGIRVNGVEEMNCGFQRVIGSGGDVGSASITCFIELDADDILTMAMYNEDSAGNPEIHKINLNMRRVTG